MCTIDDLNEQTWELIAMIDTKEELAHKSVLIESLYCIANIFLWKRSGVLYNVHVRSNLNGLGLINDKIFAFFLFFL